jgi:hypothetical protein
MAGVVCRSSKEVILILLKEVETLLNTLNIIFKTKPKSNNYNL